MEDLIRRIAKVRGVDCEPNPPGWYEQTSGEAPTYSGLLAALARSPLERQQLLRGYFEPNESEREQGLKVPTKAHRAIAALVASGHVRVILTTNFDQLIERALEEKGIVPTVVSSPDQVQGLPPLVQLTCLVVKMHGDYRDSRIKNTPEELSQYDRRLNRLLDRIFDEFGLIVCGWSAQWDPALCSAIARCRSHRFTTYWAYRGPLDTEANRLITLRRAQAIQIYDADSFFESLADRIEALEEYDRPHPLSLRIAVETLKNYLVDHRHRIRLSDLMSQETEAVYQRLFSPERFPLGGITFNGVNLLERLREYEAITERLQALLIEGAAWGETQHLDLWRRSLERIANPPRPSSASVGWTNVMSYPALRLLYAAGLAAIAKGLYHNLRGLLEVPALDKGGQRVPLLIAADTIHVVDHNVLKTGLRKNWSLPMSEYLFESLREPLREHLRSDDNYANTFDILEYLLALAYLDQDPDKIGWCPIGRFGNLLAIEMRFGQQPKGVVARIHQEVDQLGNSWPPLTAGLFGGSVERFKELEALFLEVFKLRYVQYLV
ncbi:MAG TPA: SIR2 family protein [Thermoanaerobaculia bacterium]